MDENNQELEPSLSTSEREAISNVLFKVIEEVVEVNNLLVENSTFQEGATHVMVEVEAIAQAQTRLQYMAEGLAEGLGFKIPTEGGSE